MTVREFYEGVMLPAHIRGTLALSAINRFDYETTLLPVWGETPLNKITREDVNGLLRACEQKGFGSSYPARIEGAVRKLFVFASSNGLLPTRDLPCHLRKEDNPSGKLHFYSEKPHPVHYTLQETKLLLLEIAHSPYRDFLTLQFFTGLRCIEIYALTEEDLDLSGHNLTISRKLPANYQNRIHLPAIPLACDDPQRRTIPLCKPARQACQSAVEYSRSIPGFCEPDRKPLFYKDAATPLHSHHVSKEIARIRRKTGVRNYTLKNTRSNFILLCLSLGWPESDILRYAGFSNADSLIPYRIVLDNSLL